MRELLPKINHEDINLYNFLRSNLQSYFPCWNGDPATAPDLFDFTNMIVTGDQLLSYAHSTYQPSDPRAIFGAQKKFLAKYFRRLVENVKNQSNLRSLRDFSAQLLTFH